jgi:hypothetical protein
VGLADVDARSMPVALSPDHEPCWVARAADAVSGVVELAVASPLERGRTASQRAEMEMPTDGSGSGNLYRPPVPCSPKASAPGSAPAACAPGSALHQAGIDLYFRHHDTRDGRCKFCGRPAPCQSRALGAEVIRASGEDPLSYGTVVPSGPVYRSSTSVIATVSLQRSGRLPAGVLGYALGGHGRTPVPFFEYER